MNLKGFSEKLQSLDKWANRRTKKTCHVPKLAGPEVHRGGAGGAAHIGPTGQRGSRVVGRRIWAAETQPMRTRSTVTSELLLLKAEAGTGMAATVVR